MNTKILIIYTDIYHLPPGISHIQSAVYGVHCLEYGTKTKFISRREIIDFDCCKLI